MRDILLACATIVMFVFGYFLMRQVDRFTAENQRAIAEENRDSVCRIRIAAESPALIHAAEPAMQYCTGVHPYIDFSLSSGRAETLLQRLEDGAVDFVLLCEDTEARLHPGFSLLRLPCRSGRLTIGETGLSVEDPAEEAEVCILWNRAVPSATRDRVIFVLRNEPCSPVRGHSA